MKKNQKLEIQIYEHLGIKQFQKLVFILEKAIHFRDKGKNINYHIKKGNIDELNNFKKFLYYNGTIHVRNAIGVTALIIVQPIFFSGWFLLYLIPSLIKNIYCVMLQRYNYLRINKIIETKSKRINKDLERKKVSFVDAYEQQKVLIKNKEQCLAQIDNIKKFLQGESDVFLDSNSIETLQLIKKFINENYQKNEKDEQMDQKIIVKKIGGF